MVESFDWSGFYTTLCRHGPSLLVGINEGLRDVIGEVASTTDMFWSQGLQVLLEQDAANGDLQAGVLAAFDRWRENVLETLAANFGIELDSQTVSSAAASPLIVSLSKPPRPNNRIMHRSAFLPFPIETLNLYSPAGKTPRSMRHICERDQWGIILACWAAHIRAHR